MKEEFMNLLCASLLGLTVAVSGLVWSMDQRAWGNLNLQSPVSQAVAAEASQGNTTGELAVPARQRLDLTQQATPTWAVQRESPRRLTLKGLSKGNYRSLVKTVQRVPWHSTRHSG